jgi:hypothetical protein
MMVSSLPQLAPMIPPAFTIVTGDPPSMEIFLSSWVSVLKNASHCPSGEKSGVQYAPSVLAMGLAAELSSPRK